MSIKKEIGKSGIEYYKVSSKSKPGEFRYVTPFANPLAPVAHAAMSRLIHDHNNLTPPQIKRKEKEAAKLIENSEFSTLYMCNCPAFMMGLARHGKNPYSEPCSHVTRVKTKLERAAARKKSKKKSAKKRKK